MGLQEPVEKLRIKWFIAKGTSDFNKEYRDFEIGLLELLVNISNCSEMTSIDVEWRKKQVLMI